MQTHRCTADRFKSSRIHSRDANISTSCEAATEAPPPRRPDEEKLICWISRVTSEGVYAAFLTSAGLTSKTTRPTNRRGLQSWGWSGTLPDGGGDTDSRPGIGSARGVAVGTHHCRMARLPDLCGVRRYATAGRRAHTAADSMLADRQQRSELRMRG